MKRTALVLMALCALQQTQAMDSSIVPACEDNSIVHDFLYNHERFKALWGTPEKRGTTYLKLPKDVSRIIAREALAPAIAMLKKCPSMLSVFYRVDDTFTQKLTTYKAKKEWNYFALPTPTSEPTCPKPCEGHPITKLAATTSPDCSVKIWDTHTQECVQTLRGHCGPISRIQFNKSGTQLIIAKDTYIRFWDIEHGKFVKEINTNTPIKNISFNTKETHLIALHHPDDAKDEDKHDNFVTIWDVQTGTCIRTVRPTHCDLIDASDNNFMIKRGKKHYSLWDVGNYCAAVEFLDSVNLEQALLLNCLAHTMLINKIIRKKNYYQDKITLSYLMKRFNFNKFPHLQPIFESLPRELQLGMQEHVVLIGKADPNDPLCAIL